MSNTLKPTDQERADQFATDIEQFAKFVRANPMVADAIGYQDFLAYLTPGDSTKATMADLIRTGLRAGAKVDKHTNGDFAGAILTFGRVTMKVYSDRDQVCERIVTGTREVPVEEKDPEALAAVPTRTVMRVVEDVEWRCTPLLAAEATPAEVGA